ncbi:sucrose utilization SUC1 [Fusarium sp. NRRL 25303]|nr:sucrose utilization SUC1 [Fusarium sp. NRRL 25303]
MTTPITVWPNVAAPSPLPTPGSPAPIEEEQSVELTWQERQARTDERVMRVAAAARENFLGPSYAHLPFSEKDWELGGRLRCRIVGMLRDPKVKTVWSSCRSLATSIRAQHRAFLLGKNDKLEVYSERLYPIWPIVDATDLRNKIRQSPNEGGAARCLANAVALAAIAQLKLGTAWRPSVEEAETSGLSEKLGLLDALRISFFLHIYHENALPGGTKSLVYLREAITQAQILRLDRESTYSSLSEADQHVSRRILWLLFVTERGVALLHKLPIVLKPNILFPWFGGADDRAEVLPAFLKLVHLFWVFDQSNIFEILRNIDADSDLPNMAAVAQNCLELLQQKLLDSADNDDWGPINEVQRADMFVTRQWMRAVLWRAALRFGIVIPSMNPINIAKDFLSLVSELPKAALESHGPTLEFKTFEIATAVIDAIASDHSIQNDQSRPILHQLRDILSSCRGGNRTLLSLLTIRMDAIFNSGRMLEPEGDSVAFEANLASTFQDTAELLTAQPNLTMPTYQFMEGQASQICWPPLDLGYLVRSPSPLTRMLLESMPRDVAEQDEIQQIIETAT